MTTVRRIQEVRVVEVEESSGIAGDPGPQHRGSGRSLEVWVHGEAFLMHMVRIMVGSLVEVGAGREDPEWIAGLFDAPDRKRAGPTAPAMGLTLEEVIWPDSLR
jgi:tRNA pseudouridine38-40 synthase